MDEQRIVRAFEHRLAIYRQKLGQADPLAEDDRTRWDALKYVVEAIEILAVEAGIKIDLELMDEADWEPAAQGIEAGTAETEGLGPKDESPVVATSDDAPSPQQPSAG